MHIKSDMVLVLSSAWKSAVARASEDFIPREPTLQTLHIASVAFNSLLLGEVFVPDWDMFHVRLLHPQHIFLGTLLYINAS
jgi:hypothetical protein